MAGEPQIAVELVYALPNEQEVVALEVAAGTTVWEAIKLSGLGERYPQIEADRTPVGIHGRLVTRDAKLREGDRIEIYRPLKADPKEARLRRLTRQR